MDTTFKNELKSLMETGTDPSVSFFQPTHRAGPETEQDPIRYKNLLRRAEELLAARGMRAPEASEFLKPARELLDDSFFWRTQGDGLAVFLSPDIFRTYRVPINLREFVHVGRRFLVKPLFPLFEAEGRFYVLALSQKQVRLVECTRFGVNEVTPDGVLQSVDELLAGYEPRKHLQFHTRVASPGGGTMFRSHGAGFDDAKDNILRFVRKVDEGLLGVLKGERAPLVLAGVEVVTSIFREATSYPHLLDAEIGGNPELLSLETLKDKAWEVVRPHFLEDRHEAMERCLAAMGTDLASSDLRRILPAAHTGRVESLFVRATFGRWGVFDLENLEVRVSDAPGPADDDLVDLAVVATATRGGNVHVIETGESRETADVVALFRY